jgi:RNA polymerase sigma factor (sigma-70 family)
MSSSESTPKLKTDVELLLLIVEQNDQIALQTLIEKHSTLLMSVCMQILRDQNDAEDAFQNAVITFVKNPGKINKPQFFSSWLYRVAQRESYNILRRKKRVQAEPLGEHSAVTNQFEATQDQFEELTLLHEELDQLQENYRVPLILCYLEGKTRKEAATELNVTVNSIKASLTSGRELLRKRLLKRGIALASVLAAWNSSQALVASTVSATFVQQALNNSLVNSTAAGTTSSGTSVTGSKAALIKGTTMMAVSTGKNIAIGMIGIALLLGGIVAVGVLENNKDSKTPVASEVIEKDTSEAIETGDPNHELMEIIAKIKEKESFYENIDITMHFKEDHTLTRQFNSNRPPGKESEKNQDVLEQRNVNQYVHQTLRKVTQDSMFRIEFSENVNNIFTDIIQNGRVKNSNQIKHKYQAEAFDGESHSSVAVTPKTPIPKINPNPYQVGLGSRLGSVISFSDLLQGGEHATKIIQEKSKSANPSIVRYQTDFIEENQLSDEPVVVIELVAYYIKSSIKNMIYKQKIYLAKNRNYIPMRFDVFLKDDVTSNKTYQVLTWSEPEKGIWFPKTSEMKSNTKGKKRKVSYRFDVATVAPQYPKSFFKVKEPKKTEKEENASN